jgi:hypothetical protein
MKYMQWLTLKNVVIIFSFMLASTAANAQVSGFRLDTADSLFKSKRYTQSMEHYKSIFAGGHYSPAMLLKMAYIEEGLGQTGQALYYLNLYFNATSDKTVLDKMEELADKFHLEGYQQTDRGRVLTFYSDFRWPVGLSLMAVAVLLLGIAFNQRLKKRQALVPVILLVLVLVFLGTHTFLSSRDAKGIVAHANTQLMDGPSPGAGVISVIDGGHRVAIVGHKDVWIKIQWQGTTAYIRDANLLTLSL